MSCKAIDWPVSDGVRALLTRHGRAGLCIITKLICMVY